MQQFTKAGRITRDRHALRVEIDGRNGPGDLVIGAAAVRELFDGKEADVYFVQVRSTNQVFIGWSGDGPGLPQRPGDHPPDRGTDLHEPDRTGPAGCGRHQDGGVGIADGGRAGYRCRPRAGAAERQAYR